MARESVGTRGMAPVADRLGWVCCRPFGGENHQTVYGSKIGGSGKEQFCERIALFSTVPLPQSPEDRIQLVMKEVAPAINQIITGAMTVAIGTWPTPEIPKE